MVRILHRPMGWIVRPGTFGNTEAFGNGMSLPQVTRHTAAPRFGRLDADLADVESAITRSAEYILSRQHPEGYWSGELEADSMLEADYIFLHTLLESGDPGRLKRAFN